MSDGALAALDRRSLLKAAGGAAAWLTLGFPLGPAQAQQVATPFDVNAWMQVASDGALVVMVPQAEIGQGIVTGLCAALCDELDADWSTVRFEFACGRPDYWHPILYKQEQITGGSRSMQAFFPIMRRAGATGRSMLVSAAAARWGVDSADCTTDGGFVLHGGKRLGYGELSAAAARLPVPANVALKPRSAWKLIGQPLRRLDTPAKVDGSAVFGIDVKVESMLHAAVRHAPVLGAEPARFDASKVLSRPGVRAVQRLPGAVGVVADHYWQALTAARELEIAWTPTAHDRSSDATVQARQQEAMDKGVPAMAPGGQPVEVEQAFGRAASRFEAEYGVPYLAHACLEPMGCVARVEGGRAELWLATQDPTRDAQAAARALGADPADVTVHMTFCGGGFGRRIGDEHVREAVLLSQALRRPVKVTWSREEDMLADNFRPSMRIRMQAALDAEGLPVATRYRVAGSGFWAYQRPGLVTAGLDPTSVTGLFDSPYRTAARAVESFEVPAPVRVGTWRSTGNSQNNFFNESFFDELAHAARRDPLAYRRALLADDPRALAVLDAVERLSGWNRPVEGRYRGVAFMRSALNWKTRIAQVVELSRQDGGLRIEKVTVVVDSGLVVNPNLARQNLEGGVIFGLTAALYGEVKVQDGRPQPTNFHDYPLLRIDKCPAIEIEVLQGDDAPGSFGEVATAPVIPALANAVFAATGQRVRRLPLTGQGIEFV